MKKFFATAALSLLSLCAMAVEPVPMVDVKVDAGFNQLRTDVPRDFGDTVMKAYVKAMNNEIQNGPTGKLDILAVGDRATVVIEEFYNPADFTTQAQNEMARNQMQMNPGAPGARAAFDREYGNGRPETMKVSGYIIFKEKRMPFEETMSKGSPSDWLASQLGREAYRRIRSL